MVFDKEYVIDELGVLFFIQVQVEVLYVGEVGYFVVVIKVVVDVRVGDIIIMVNSFVVELLLGYIEVNFMVFCGLFFIDVD